MSRPEGVVRHRTVRAGRRPDRSRQGRHEPATSSAGTITQSRVRNRRAPSDPNGPVTNRHATTGGTREVFTRVQQADIDAAMASLTKDLQSQFAAWVAAPDDLPHGRDRLPGDGQARDAGPDGRSVHARQRRGGDLPARRDGDRHGRRRRHQRRSTRSPRSGSRSTSRPTTPSRTARSRRPTTTVRPTASWSTSGSRRTAPPSPSSTRPPCATSIKGKSVDEARQILGRYGTVTIDTWPGFVSSIPTLDFRLDLTVNGANGAASPSPGTVGRAHREPDPRSRPRRAPDRGRGRRRRTERPSR